MTVRRFFEYTDFKHVSRSTAVNSLAYNENNKELLVTLKASGSYIYTGVPADRWKRIAEAQSVGREYTRLKQAYGSSDGPIGQVIYAFVSKGRPDTRPVALPSRDSRGRFISSRATATPKALVETPDTVYTDSQSTGRHLTLTAGNTRISSDGSAIVTGSISPVRISTGTKRNHEIKFVVLGGNDIKSYNVEANTVDEAVGELSKATSALGLEVTVKEVVTYFE